MWLFKVAGDAEQTLRKVREQRCLFEQRLERRPDVQRYGYAEPTPPTRDHLTLLARASWGMGFIEFGAAAINGKHPYGSSDVEDSLERLLPHLSEFERLQVHYQLPSVLAWICRHPELGTLR